jgi:dCTP deaminase
MAEPVDGPWNEWIPGALSNDQLFELCEKGLITGRSFELQNGIDMSSIDLTLSDEGFEMIEGAVKPSGEDPYGWFIRTHKLGHKLQKTGDGSYLLRAKQTYVFRLLETLERKVGEAGIYGQATAKSSVGRVDVLARLIVDGMDKYEGFDPEGLKRQSGILYLEITPITFDVKVRAGVRLSQLRLFYGEPENSEIKGEEVFNTIFRGTGNKSGNLTVDLDNENIGGLWVAAFQAIPPNPGDAIPLWKSEHPLDPWKYWKFATAGGTKRIKIEESQFYILKSKEKIFVPAGVAIYCRASDETIGEMRIHYAGFAHPLFGGQRDDGTTGTPLIFEVRGHQVNVSLADGETMANIILYRMSKDCKRRGASPYERQTLRLSQFFGEWPGKLKRKGGDGTVEPA